MGKKMFRKRWALSQLQFISLGFFLLILAGTLLLMLPISSRTGEWTGFFDALFTATSAGCVTGLVVLDTGSHWSLFGQTVLLCLIQIGGLGFISIGVFFSILFRRRIGLRERGLLQESVNAEKIGGIVKLAKKIILGTALVEGSGALLLSIRFIPLFGPAKGIWFSVFHSVSAFCNAGFDLLGGVYGPYSSLSAFTKDPLVNLAVCSLILTGGIGFLVWDDITKKGLRFRKYMLHTKIVLMVNLVLVTGGSLLFLFSEAGEAFTGMTFGEQLLGALFSSVTARTAGFNTVDTGHLSQAGRLITIALMFIGGSSGSTAGGIKTTTVFVLLSYLVSNVRQNQGVFAFGRRLEEEAVRSASSIATLHISYIFAVTVIILSLQKMPLGDVLFETVSAISTVGMTTGITRDMAGVSRLLLVLLMYLGRVGSLSFALAFTQNLRRANISLPREAIRVG